MFLHVKLREFADGIWCPVNLTDPAGQLYLAQRGVHMHTLVFDDACLITPASRRVLLLLISAPDSPSNNCAIPVGCCHFDC